jgi:hypothetical protein
VNPVEFRPLTDAERRALAGLSSGRNALMDSILFTVFLFLVLLGAAVLVLRLVSGPTGPWEEGLAAGAAAVLAVGASVRRSRRSRGALGGAREACAADLAGGRASAQTFDVADAIRVEEREDEGSSFYLKLADGRVLFLSGQYLYEPEEDGSFPSTRVRVTRAPRSGLLFDLECLGTPLKTSSTRPPFTASEHGSGAVPADGAILQTDFESLRAGGASA